MATVEEADVTMEEEPTTSIAGVKRKAENNENTLIVDPDDPNTIVGTSKKPRIELNETLKIQCIQGAIEAFHKLFEELKLPTKDYMNLDVASQISNITFSAHSVLRQEANGTLKELKTKAIKTGFKVCSGGSNYPIGAQKAIDLVKAAFQENGLEYKKYTPKDRENWYGTAGPYLNFFTGWGLRKKELRLGHAQMSIGKEDGKSKTFMVEKYGIHGGQHILLEGCTFPPEKRSSMAQSMGPLTILLQYIRSENKYVDKWRAACKRTFAFIPDIDYILKEIQGKNASDIKHIIGLIGDISRIATTRQATRAFFPINIIALLCGPRDRVSAITGLKTHTIKVNGGTYNRGIELTKSLNFSGHGAFFMWMLAGTFSWELNGSWTAEEAKQIAYHCVFGTFKEDLGILSQITNLGNWFTREEFGARFQKCNTSKEKVKFPLIQQKYWSKLTSASQTKLLAGTFYQDSSLPCFSGQRKVTFSRDFFENIEKKSNKASAGKTLLQLTEMLSGTLDLLLEQIRQGGGSLEMGTTQWFDVSKLTVEGSGDATNICVNTTGEHFLG